MYLSNLFKWSASVGTRFFVQCGHLRSKKSSQHRNLEEINTYAAALCNSSLNSNSASNCGDSRSSWNGESLKFDIENDLNVNRFGGSIVDGDETWWKLKLIPHSFPCIVPPFVVTTKYSKTRKLSNQSTARNGDDDLYFCAHGIDSRRKRRQME